ncbi:Eco57I restriction-modification methylase domain-containing protein [Candidatus Binatus sp.]|uniref:Eco57I restriction-modification methylase domain-containing protein n=1 Tax=Candidatus Binatus sp. TaxID=2811406 RepID=UPI00272CDE06|nr:Eco57I restriction-modification methylase domain-containing protein [Candidatus Binatus sp.]
MERKEGGIYLTPVSVADFIAAQISFSGGVVRILDPAAGSGTLLCAAVERLVSTCKSFREAEITAYETDPNLQVALTDALDNLRRWASERHVQIRVLIEKNDFVLAHSELLGTNRRLFQTPAINPFDLVIANPPYFKLSKVPGRQQNQSTVIRDQPNIYTLFMAAGAELLKDGGELLFIVPRSFASGPYFRSFRESFFGKVRPVRVHIFGSRRDAFGRDAVLQENIIFKGVRDRRWPQSNERFMLCVSSTGGISDLDKVRERNLPLDRALSMATSSKVLRLPLQRKEDEAVELVDSWTGSLHEYGMEISTGPVVPFRAAELLDDTGCPANRYAPLIWMHHVHAMRISFPNGTRKPQFIEKRASERSLLIPNRNYVFLRRFSAKEEARRLVAAPWLKGFAASPLLGIENHLNYIYRLSGELDEREAYGLAALLCSELLDTYFRVSSGNTQVSATELRAMPLPPHETILAIGHRAKELNRVGDELEEIVRDAINAAIEKGH